LLCNLIFHEAKFIKGWLKNQPLIFILEKMDNNEVEKAKALIIVEIIEYVPHTVVSKTVIKKTTGNISAVSVDTGEALTEKIIPFDTFVQIIDGKAEIVIDGISNLLDTGQSIIIPAHTSNIAKANERFKMISTIIKSGYE
jgi:quercetin dioxygenase-like cupin family protein